MALTETGRFGSGPCSGGCTGSVLTPSEDVPFITTVVNSVWKGKVIPRLISMGQVFCYIAGHNYKNNLKFDTFIMAFDKLLVVMVTIIGIKLVLLNTGLLISMILTNARRFNASPSSRGCTGSVLTPNEDVGGITTVVNSLWKGKALCGSVSICQGTRILAYYIYKIPSGRCRKGLVQGIFHSKVPPVFHSLLLVKILRI